MECGWSANSSRLYYSLWNCTRTVHDQVVRVFRTVNVILKGMNLFISASKLKTGLPPAAARDAHSPGLRPWSGAAAFASNSGTMYEKSKIVKRVLAKVRRLLQ